MKISFEKKILYGFIINLSVVAALLIIYIARISTLREFGETRLLDWFEFSLFALSFVLLVVVYFIIRAQSEARKSADRLILENRELLLSIINNTSNPISIKRINGEYLLVNDRFKELFQIDQETVIGKTDHDILPIETADIYRHSDLEVVKAQKEIKVEETIVELDGLHTYLSVKFPLFDTNGRVYAVGSIGTDITERKTTEESLKGAETFFNLSLDIMVIANGEKFLKINPSLSRILGYSNKELLENPFITFIYKEDLEKTKEELKKLQSGVDTVNFENRWVTKGKKTIWLRWIATIDMNTGLMYAVARDITERKVNEKEIKMAGAFFDMSYNLFLVAKGEYLTKVNKAFTRILGYKQEDMNDRSFLSFIHPDDLKSAQEAIAQLQKGETVINFRTRVKCKTGNYITLNLTATSDVETGEIYAVGRDVTDLVEKEESLQLMKSFFENSFNVFIVAKGQEIIKINPAFTRLLGYTMEEIEDKSVIDFIHPDYKEFAIAQLIKRLKGEEVPRTVRYPVKHKDGTYKWTETMITTNIETGTSYLVLRDIDEKIKNEESLKVADTFFNISLNIMVILSGDSFLRVNPSTSKVLGYTEKELLDQEFKAFIYPEDITLTLSELEKLKNGSPIVDFKSRWICKDASIKWLSWTFTTGIHNHLIYGVANDITEKLKLEEEEKEVSAQLQENELRLRLILDNIGDGVVVANTERKILLANFLANELFGEDGNGERSARLSDKFDVYDPVNHTVFPEQNLPITKAFEGVATDDVDVIIENRESKEKKRVLLSGRPLADQDNKVVAAVVTIKDITRYKQLEEELEEKEKELRSSIGFKKESQRP